MLHEALLDEARRRQLGLIARTYLLADLGEVLFQSTDCWKLDTSNTLWEFGDRGAGLPPDPPEVIPG